jgi:TRAP-type C4-dicarboxylate transport system substrate-binding protein
MAVAGLAAQEIKLASVAPEASPWGAALNQLAVDWRTISNGRVRVRVYHNAIAGDEADILRKIRIGQLQAGVLTSSGLKQIVPEVFSVSVPFLIRSEGKLDYVMENISPELDEIVEQNRLHILAWSRAGWVHFFSKAPVVYPEDLQPQRLAADPADEELQQAFRLMGFRPTPIPQSELLTSLNSGLADAFYTSPLVAAGYQWFGLAPNMLGVPVAPFLGAIVISDQAWRRLPDSMKDDFLASAQRVADQIDAEVLDLEREALETMQQYGLHVQPATPEVVAAWEAYVERYEDAMLGVFDPAMTERVRELVAEYDGP